MTTKDYLDEYAGAYRVVDNCEEDGYGCKMCLEDRERMQEIEKELEAGIRKEVVEELQLEISNLITESESYVPFQKIHYQSALKDLCNLL